MRNRKTARTILSFVRRELLDGVAEDGDPLADGYLDSLAIEQLVAFLEETFEITVEDEEIVDQNFLDIETLVAFVELKREGVRP